MQAVCELRTPRAEGADARPSPHNFDGAPVAESNSRAEPCDTAKAVASDDGDGDELNSENTAGGDAFLVDASDYAAFLQHRQHKAEVGAAAAAAATESRVVSRHSGAANAHATIAGGATSLPPQASHYGGACHVEAARDAVHHPSAPPLWACDQPDGRGLPAARVAAAATEQCIGEPVSDFGRRAAAFTNDASYERTRRAARRTYRAKIGAAGVSYRLTLDDDDDDDDVHERRRRDPPSSAEIAAMDHDEMMQALGAKYDKPSGVRRLGAAVSSLLDGINNLVLPETTTATTSSTTTTANVGPPVAARGVPRHAAPQRPTLRSLGVGTIREALDRRLALSDLARCDLTVADFVRERIDVSALQKYGLSLFDVTQTLGMHWQVLCAHMGLHKALLTRESRWFDPHALALCIAQHGANLTADLGFGLDDVKRVQCLDFEAAQLGLTIDALCELGMDRRFFVGLPWYMQTMAGALGLRKEHLTDTLRLTAADYAYLVQRRKWTARDMRDTLEFTDDELRAAGVLQPVPQAGAVSRRTAPSLSLSSLSPTAVAATTAAAATETPSTSPTTTTITTFTPSSDARSKCAVRAQLRKTRLAPLHASERFDFELATSGAMCTASERGSWQPAQVESARPPPPLVRFDTEVVPCRGGGGGVKRRAV